MSAASSPSSLSDYFIIQPHSFRDLPVRLRSPNRHSEQDSQLSEDEFECISSPDTVRSLNSTPVAGSVRSVSVDDDHSEQLEDHQPGIASSVHDRTISSSACGEISECTDDASCKFDYFPIPVSRQPDVHTTDPTTPSPIRRPYVYTTPSEDGYPGTGVLSYSYSQPLCATRYGPLPTEYENPLRARTAEHDRFSGAYTKPQPMAAASAYQNLCYTGHDHIDIEIMHQLIDSACSSRLRHNTQTPESRDAVLRFQMMKRLRNLPPDHLVVRRAIADPLHLPQPYRNQWTAYERRNIYRNVFTDVEKVALFLLFDTHKTHFHTECLFTDIVTTHYGSHDLCNSISQDCHVVSQQLAFSIQSSSFSSLSGNIMDKILHNDELRYATQQKITAKTLRLRNSASDSEVEKVVNDNFYHVPGAYGCTNHEKRHLLTDYFQCMALKDAFDETLRNLPMRTSASDYATCLPSAQGNNYALQDYETQLFLLEQQNKNRLMMARAEQEEEHQTEKKQRMASSRCGGFRAGAIRR